MLKLLKLIFGAPVEAQHPAHGAADVQPADIQPAFEVVHTDSTCLQDGAATESIEVALEKPPTPPSVVSQPAVKSQAQIDEDLVASEAWLGAVATGEKSWSSKLDALIAAVQAAQQEDRTVPLMLLSHYFWLKTPMPELGTTMLLNELRERVEKDFSIKSYRAYIENKTKTRWNSYPRSVEFYVGEFLQVRPSYLDGLRDLFERIPELIAIVEEHYAVLSTTEKELKPSAGGNNLLRFQGFLTKYSQEHLPGVTPQDFFPGDSPRYIRDYFGSDIKTSGYLVLWGMMGVVQAKRSSGATSSTSQVGIEFEKQLIAEISEEFPAARIDPTPVTGDQGADVILVIGGVKIVIQAKKYTGVVGNAAVQEVFAAMQFYDADYAMVITNSRYTTAAQTLASKIGVELATSGDYLRRIQQLLI